MNHRSKGLTFVETLIGLALLSILTLSLYIVFKSGYDSWTKSDERLEIYQNARAAVDTMFLELAEAVPNENVGGNSFKGTDKSIWFLVYVKDAARYDEIMYLLDANNALVRRYHTNADYDETTFDMDGGAIIDAPMAYNLHADSVHFRYWDSGSVSGTPTDVWEDSDGGTVDSLDAWTDDDLQTGDPCTDTDLPMAVRIDLGFEDADETEIPPRTWQFRTAVYLPNS